MSTRCSVVHHSSFVANASTSTRNARCNICKQIIIYLLYKSGMLTAGIRNILKLLTVDGICRCAATQPTLPQLHLPATGRTMRPYDFLAVAAAESSLTVQPITGLVAVDMNSRQQRVSNHFIRSVEFLAQRTQHNYSFYYIFTRKLAIGLI